MSGPPKKAGVWAGRLADALFGIRTREKDWDYNLSGPRPELNEEGRIVGYEPPQSVQEAAADELRDLVDKGDVDALRELFVVLEKRAAAKKRRRELREAAETGKPLNRPRTDLAWELLAEAWRLGEFKPPEPWKQEDGKPNVDGFRHAVQELDARLQKARMDGNPGFLTTALPEGQSVWGLLSGPGKKSDAPSSEQSLERTGTEDGQHGRKWRKSVQTFMERGESMSACVRAWARGNVIFEDDGQPHRYEPPDPEDPEAADNHFGVP